MKRNCVMCDKEINIEKDNYSDGESLNEYWCFDCGTAARKMSKVEELKQQYKTAFIESYGDYEIVSVDKNDLDWLLAQSEKVERYEKSLKRIEENGSGVSPVIAGSALQG